MSSWRTTSGGNTLTLPIKGGQLNPANLKGVVLHMGGIKFSKGTKSLAFRATTAGLTGFHPHKLRHTAAHRWLAAGGSEGGLMAVAGWTRPDMLLRYTRAQASGARPMKPAVIIVPVLPAASASNVTIERDVRSFIPLS